jgi:sporulation integral membrane protein YlbJ
LHLPPCCSFPIIISFLCGYPLGAKYSCELLEKGYITDYECQRLLNIACNPSPLFLIGSIGTVMLKNQPLGYILLISNYLSCFIMGMLTYRHQNSYDHNYIQKASINANNNFGSILKSSIDNSIKTTLSIGGYITTFSVIIDILNNSKFLNFIFSSFSVYSYSTVKSCFLGFIEVTKGCYLVCDLSLNMPIKIFILGLLTGFSGICILTQVYSFTYKHINLSIFKYVKLKIVQSFICAILCIGIYSFIPNNTSILTLSYNLNISNYNFYFCILGLLVFPILIFRIYKIIFN